jgi:PleD family two-component response regulator
VVALADAALYAAKAGGRNQIAVTPEGAIEAAYRRP